MQEYRRAMLAAKQRHEKDTKGASREFEQVQRDPLDFLVRGQTGSAAEIAAEKRALVKYSARMERAGKRLYQEQIIAGKKYLD
jgi:hypothetical protein